MTQSDIAPDVKLVYEEMSFWGHLLRKGVVYLGCYFSSKSCRLLTSICCPDQGLPRSLENNLVLTGYNASFPRGLPCKSPAEKFRQLRFLDPPVYSDVPQCGMRAWDICFSASLSRQCFFSTFVK